jgi:hypothetical protein
MRKQTPKYLTAKPILHLLWTLLLAASLAFPAGLEALAQAESEWTADAALVPEVNSPEIVPPTILEGALPQEAYPQSALDKTGTQWTPYLEWSLSNPSYSGNPFDLLATVVFTHQGSGETRRTEMFYAGGSTWKFRFSGTRTGRWTFTTTSADPELNGHYGTITINSNPDANIKGFLVRSGNKFAQQTGENGALQGVIYNIWQGSAFPYGVDNWYSNPNLIRDLNNGVENIVLKHGANSVYSGTVGNRFFKLEAATWEEHNSVNPDFRTFETLEKVISHLHTRGIHTHIWMWGDSERKWNQVGVGGINGEPDRRLQRYIAARLGPLPGWTMGYGFDLGEWVTKPQLDSWAEYMNQRMGWPHLLFSRGYATANMSGVSYSSNGPGSPVGELQTSRNGPASFNEVVQHINSDRNRPHLYEERFIYLREMPGAPNWTMDRTRRVMWWNAMAGGVGAYWGVWDGPDYPNPEQMAAHARFWRGRFRLDLERASQLTDGAALKTPDSSHLIFYKESTASIRMDLASIGGPRRAVAVDTKKAYAEISLGVLEARNQTWTAPYSSDWAIALSPASGQDDPPSAPHPPAPPYQGPGMRVNFQTSTTESLPGYLADDGSVFGSRSEGKSYGWSADNRSNARERKAPNSPDKVSDTFNHMQRGASLKWEIAVPNGQYEVVVVAGDPENTNSNYRINVEGVKVIDARPGGSNWVSGWAVVTVSDGRLTISNRDGADNNKITYVEITPAEMVRYKMYLPAVRR